MNYIVLYYLCILIKLVSYNNSNLNFSRLATSEIQQKITELKADNEKLLGNISELMKEHANIIAEMWDMELAQRDFTAAILTYWNCTKLKIPLQEVNHNVIMVGEDVLSIKSFVEESLTAFGYKYGLINNDAEENTNRCDCVPQSIDGELFDVACSAENSNGEWTVIQRRMDGTENFFRPWKDYKAGFGNRSGEFFIGLENLHLLTTCAKQELQIDIMYYDDVSMQTVFDFFQIGDESVSYMIEELGNYTGIAAEALSFHKSYKFSTYDRDNDVDEDQNCAQRFRSGWWFTDCFFCNLNGVYDREEIGITCHTHARKHESIKFVEMKIRPKDF